MLLLSPTAGTRQGETLNCCGTICGRKLGCNIVETTLKLLCVLILKFILCHLKCGELKMTFREWRHHQTFPSNAFRNLFKMLSRRTTFKSTKWLKQRLSMRGFYSSSRHIKKFSFQLAFFKKTHSRERRQLKFVISS